jgi:flagellar hook assembly protein FlgD
VNSLVNSERSAGSYTATWDGENHYGNRVSSGVYIYRLQTAQGTMSKKMMLLK